jgi:NAD+ kinase
MMRKIAVVGLEKNNVWDFFHSLENFKKKYSIDFIPFIYSNKKQNLYNSLENEGYKPSDFEAAVSVGGDGTFLYTSRVFAGTEVAVFGVNKGHLGFNTNIEENEFEEYFKKYLENRIEFTYKNLLDVSVEGDSNLYLVINEGVITYAGISRTIRLKVFVGDNPICDFRGDGLIVSSPTGSTAYNLSAGGPILHPSVNAFVVTPICPLTLAIRPYIIPFDEVINILVEKPSSKTQITLDGQKIITLDIGQKIVIKKSDKRVKIIKGSKNFSEILKTKLGWMV